ncbi:MAG: hypothetical protein ACK4PK_03065 [Alphaproteobacteria bacterium]
MDVKFKIPGGRITMVITLLLLVIIIMLAVDMRKRDRSFGDKIENAMQELQR